MMKITILGTGAFGLAIGSLLHKYNDDIDIEFWTAFREEKEEIERTHSYEKVLPDIEIDSDIKITLDIEEAVRNSSLIIVAIPCNKVRSVLERVKPFSNKKMNFLFVSKGLEEHTNFLMSKVFEEVAVLGNFSFLAGPSFAKDLIKNVPIGLVLATTDDKTSDIVKDLFKKTNVDLKICSDIVGVQYCSVLKNSFAILMGALSVKYHNDSSQAYFLTRMIDELRFLVVELGGQKETAMTYAGIGDLLLTCSSENSRNYRYGMLLASNLEEAEHFSEVNTVEGRFALKSVLKLCKEREIEIKLLLFLADMIEGNSNIDDIFVTLEC